MSIISNGNVVIDSGSIDNNEVDTNHLMDGAVTDAKIDGMSASKLTGALPAIDGSALTNLPGGGEASVRAWVNFNGTNMSVRDSGNVSSVSDNGTGEFIVNFSTSFANTNYVFAGAGRDVNTNTSILGAVNYGRSNNIKETGRCEICSYNDATNALIDQPEINATFFYG